MGVVTLDSDLGIEHCAALKQALGEHLDAPQRAVDAGAVERIHTASLQLLVAWWRDRSLAGRPTRWEACSDALRSAAGTLGLDAALDLDKDTAQQPPAVENPA